MVSLAHGPYGVRRPHDNSGALCSAGRKGQGEDNSDQGLGLRIVTVQIKEAVVSSSRLWENLQKPYRSEQAQLARLAELQSAEVIAQREMAAERLKETQRRENERTPASIQAALVGSLPEIMARLPSPTSCGRSRSAAATRRAPPASSPS